MNLEVALIVFGLLLYIRENARNGGLSLSRVIESYCRSSAWLSAWVLSSFSSSPFCLLMLATSVLISEMRSFSLSSDSRWISMSFPLRLSFSDMSLMISPLRSSCCFDPGCISEAYPLLCVGREGADLALEVIDSLVFELDLRLEHLYLVPEVLDLFSCVLELLVQFRVLPSDLLDELFKLADVYVFFVSSRLLRITSPFSSFSL